MFVWGVVVSGRDKEFSDRCTCNEFSYKSAAQHNHFMEIWNMDLHALDTDVQYKVSSLCLLPNNHFGILTNRDNIPKMTVNDTILNYVPQATSCMF